MLRAYKAFWKRYADFSGYSTRSEFWWVTLWQLLLFFPVQFLIDFALVFLYAWAKGSVSLPHGERLSEITGGVFLLGLIMSLLCLWILYFLATIIPYYSLMVRRLRDADYHWAFVFLSIPHLLLYLMTFGEIGMLALLLFPFALVFDIILIVLFCQPSQ